ncbi:MAG: HAD family hydrolase [Candidatus Woesearchaeota archaeon]
MGKIIQVAGVSGSGKGRAVEGIEAALESAGYDVVRWREPQPLRHIAKWYKQQRFANPYVETMVFAADRLITYITSIRPHVHDPNIVLLGDRGKLDSMAYQGRDVPLGLIEAVNSGFPDPDLQLILEVSGKEGYRRSLAREQSGGEAVTKNEMPEAIDKLAAIYRELNGVFPRMAYIDTTQISPEESLRIAMFKVWRLLGEWRDVKAVGFDLDNTLYPTTPQMDEIVQQRMCELATAELGYQVGDVRTAFDSLYAQHKSASTALSKLGVMNGKALAQQALAEAPVHGLIKPDPTLVEMLDRIQFERKLFLITTSPRDVALLKLAAIGIDPDVFDLALYGEAAHLQQPLLRDDGSAYRHVAQYFGLPLKDIGFVDDRASYLEVLFWLGGKTMQVNYDKPSRYAHACGPITSLECYL